VGAYEVSRSTVVDADPARLHTLLEDFHAWVRWSPWEGTDPALQRTYTGAESGPGAHYAWSGNRKAGKGSMEITASSPEAVAIDLEFLKPFRSTSKVRFDLVHDGDATRVTWTMSGTQAGLMGVLGKVYPMDRLIGPDFERGLAQLKTAAETSAAGG
jgi:hypothetical protein